MDEWEEMIEDDEYGEHSSRGLGIALLIALAGVALIGILYAGACVEH